MKGIKTGKSKVAMKLRKIRSLISKIKLSAQPEKPLHITGGRKI